MRAGDRRARVRPDHPRVATVASNLGNALQDLGEVAAARDCYERALAIDEQALGPEHPELAIDLNNLGLAQWDLGEYATARVRLERALVIYDRRPVPPPAAIPGGSRMRVFVALTVVVLGMLAALGGSATASSTNQHWLVVTQPGEPTRVLARGVIDAEGIVTDVLTLNPDGTFDNLATQHFPDGDLYDHGSGTYEIDVNQSSVPRNGRRRRPVRHHRRHRRVCGRVGQRGGADPPPVRLLADADGVLAASDEGVCDRAREGDARPGLTRVHR
jgi:tetratricopeptide (TPR) repeat protein